jgi:hydroxymethylglutaryl-CoA lyase
MPTVRLFEVSPRDGLQNEPEIVSTDDKVALIARLVDAGFRDIEVTSFVSPRFIPQLADATEVVRRLRRVEGVRYWALVPNPVGLERALDAGMEHIATFMSASETHNQKNVNRTIRESLAGLKKVIGTAVAEGIEVRSYISTVFGCPYEGAVDVARVVDLALALQDAGASSIALGDTTGMAQPSQVVDVVARVVAAGVPIDRIACHFHDTRGTAVVNAYAAFGAGVRCFDGAIAGIGGCPYAPGAAGNAATEDLVHLFERLGGSDIDPASGFGPMTGVDLDLAAEAGHFVERALGRPLPGRFHQYHHGRTERNNSRAAKAAGA